MNATDEGTFKDGLSLSRAGMVFAAIKDIAESLELDPNADYEVTKKALSIMGMATLGSELISNVLESEVRHA